MQTYTIHMQACKANYNTTDAWHKVVKAYPACCLAGGQHTRVQQSCYGFVLSIYYSFATVLANIYMNTI